MKRIPSLDGLRGYAVLMVLAAHLPRIGGVEYFDQIYKVIKTLNLGYLGVDVFFVLSGYLITMNLLSYKKNWVSLKHFYLNRALRIFPIYYLTLFLTMFFLTTKGWEWNFLYFSNYYFSWMQEAHPLRHTWSLAVEEHFYLIWPFLLILNLRDKQKYLFLFIFIFLFIVALYNYTILPDRVYANNILYRGTQFRFISLFLGSMIALKEPLVIAIFQKRKYLSVISFILLYLLLGIILKKDLYRNINLLNYIYFPILSILLFLIAKTPYNNLHALLFENKIITYIGSISYGLYLYHFPILYFFEMTSQQTNNKLVDISLVLLVFIFIFLISVLSKFFIEDPILKNKITIPLK